MSPLPNPFKLERLKIVAYSDRDRQETSRLSTFEAMFNPASYTEEQEVDFATKQPIGASASEAKFVLKKPQEMQIELLLDGTGVESPGLKLAPQKSVSQRVDDFFHMAARLNGDIHEPNFLRLQWGTSLNFSCRLKKATVAYTSFDRSGDPIRAKLNITVISDQAAKTIALKASLKSPDVTHTRTVRAGDTLPLLAKEIYGSDHHYLFIARANELDDFRDLAPGRELVFPPLVTP